MIGGTGVANVDLPTSDPNIKFRRKFDKTKGQPLLTSFIGNGNRCINAIVLVFNKEGKELQDLELNPNHPFLKLNDNLIKIINANLIDMVVYGRRAPFDKCTIYERLAPTLSGRKYTLREYDVESDKENDNTLNRCTINTDTIVPEAFKLGTATPGADNDCSGAHFILEEHTSQLFNVLPQVLLKILTEAICL